MKVELHANQGKVIDGHRDARGVGMSGRYYANAFMGGINDYANGRWGLFIQMKGHA